MTTETQIVIDRPVTADVAAGGSALVTSAREIVVTNRDEDAAAQQFLLGVSRMRKTIEDRFAPVKTAAHKAHKEVCALETSLLAPCDEARKIAQGKILTFQREEQKRAEEEARRQAEAARKVEEARRQAEIAAAEKARKEAEAAALAAAQAAEASGNRAAADAILETAEQEQAAMAAETAAVAAAPVVAPYIPPAPQVAETRGVATRTTWRGEVHDLHALIRYVALHPEMVRLLDANTAQINALARAQRDLLAIPGIRAVSEESLAVSRAG